MAWYEQITYGKERNHSQERYSLSSLSSSTSVAVSSSAKSKTSVSEAAEGVSQTVREESVESVAISSSLDDIDVFLQAFQHTQEYKVLLNIGGVKYERSQWLCKMIPLVFGQLCCDLIPRSDRAGMFSSLIGIHIILSSQKKMV